MHMAMHCMPCPLLGRTEASWDSSVDEPEQDVLTACFLNELSTLCQSYEDLLGCGLRNGALEVCGDIYGTEGTVHLRGAEDVIYRVNDGSNKYMRVFLLFSCNRELCPRLRIGNK